MFINLTNHPSDHWEGNQIAAASLYGDVIDWPFPVVQPSASHDDIQRLAEDVHGAIANKFGDKVAAVHIMGEFTLCYALVSLFKKNGIRCLASTTERTSIDNPDGTKTSTFNFVQFREY